jgi:hypothetical protein
LAVSKTVSAAPLAFALPEFMNPRPLSGHLLGALIERSRDPIKELERHKELGRRVSDIVSCMGLERYASKRVSAELGFAQCERLCRLFCGDRPTVLITEESGHAAFIVLTPVDTALLHRLAGLLDEYGSPVVAARLVCAAMLGLRDTPERAADLLKLYSHLILRSPVVQPPVPAMSLHRLIAAVQAHAPGCLLADELDALKRHFEVAAQTMDIDSDDVNSYLQDVSGADFTAKDFRTWSGTVLAAWALEELGQFGSQTQAKRQVVAAVESVSTELGNTPAICRRCYVHPEVFGAHLDGSLGDILEKEAARKLSKDLAGLTPEEAAVLALLSRRLAEERSQTG